ncbi:hypothetical protein LCGC14_1030170 [marine sediment metagenome]|uniref:Uncharacterized protein n=1 Tax=marine sediment metagenome TaxID=412755 RepID=A0A0F9NGK0_9ZZZZ
MVSCANITIEKIRAVIQIGDKEFVTPDIKSFNVTRSRSSLAATFSASIEVPITQKFATGTQVVIKAGTEGDLQTIFTGSVRSVTVNPAFEKATSYIITLSGADKFQELEGKNISRRQRTRAVQTFAAITSVTKRPQRGISYDVRIGGGSGSATYTADDTQIGEHSKIVSTDRPSYDPLHNAKIPGEIDDESGSQSGGTGAGSITEVRPSSVAVPVGGKVRFIANATYAAGDSWTVSDTKVGTIEDRQNGTAIYTQIGLGENIIKFIDDSRSSIGTATALGISVHDHSSLGNGGPAFGVYASE